jgi:hypothetical protein
MLKFFIIVVERSEDENIHSGGKRYKRVLS